MSLRRQLFLVLSVLFMVVLMVILWASLSGTRRYLEQQLASHAQDAATALSITLQQTLGKGDMVLVGMQVSSVFDRGYFQQVYVLAPDRTPLIKKELPEKIDDVPAWFSRLLPIQTTPGEAYISSGWRQLGKVLVVSQPTIAYQYLWHAANMMSLWIAGIFAISLMVMQLLLRFILEPLQRIEASARAVQEKRFGQIEKVPSAPELGRVVRAMNDMSRRVAEMLDIEAAKAEELRKTAYEDEVTGLDNRHGFELRLKDLLSGEAHFATAALIAIDLNDMRLFCRAQGFHNGLALMQAVVRAVQEQFAGAPPLLAGRVNDFTFYFGIIDAPETALAKDVAKLRDRIAAVIDLSPAAGQVSFSMGLVRFDSDCSRSEVFSRSDLAVESARQSGRNMLVSLPDDPVETSALGSFNWRVLIESALREGRWAMVKQAVVQLSQPKRRLHTELMARLIDEKGNHVPASIFLPMALRHRLMPSVDRALIALGLEHLLRTGGDEHVALNLSYQGIASEEFMDWLDLKLADLGGKAARLLFELSEFACLRNIEAAQRAMAMARKHGAKFGIDSFGLDPGAIKLLRQMPPDYVKLAGSQITGIADDANTLNIVLSITRLARSLDVKVFAKSIESDKQVAALLAAGVDGGQGFLFGAPV
ncbi:MAG: EAL domain-containing protein [Betaproteobacteria bacterium]|nr:EAL domain-containing protein [Betaproteobacteria bacterium]